MFDATLLKPIRTFKDLYGFCEIVYEDRDDFGYYRVPGTSLALHIYFGNTQVNICVKDDHGNWESIMNILWYEGVILCSVKNGAADYDGINYPLDTDLDIPYPVHNGMLVRRIINEIISHTAMMYKED